MQRTSAIVERGLLYQPTTGADPIVVGTAAWFDWLEQHTAFTFVDRVFGNFLARKRGTAPGEWEWQAWHAAGAVLPRLARPFAHVDPGTSARHSTRSGRSA